VRVLVFGTFDHLHPGHRFVLDQAQSRGDPFVIVACDATVIRIKGHAPDQDQETRRNVVATAYPSVAVLLGDEDNYLAPVRAVAPQLILLGYDQQLPPGVKEEDLPCPVERLDAFKPEQYKSSMLLKKQD
jgi:FAD synthetase